MQLFNKSQHLKIKQLQDKLATAERQNLQLNNELAAQLNHYQQSLDACAAFVERQQHIQNELQQRKNAITKLINLPAPQSDINKTNKTKKTNAKTTTNELQNWASVRLPADVVQLYQRTATTGKTDHN